MPGSSKEKKENPSITRIFLHFSKRETGFEPAAPTLARWCSTTEPLAHKNIKLNRGDRIRTCDLLVPNQAL